MQTPSLWLIPCLLLLQGCIPRTAIVHDGLSTTVIDSTSQKPVEDAFVYDRLEGQMPGILARSNEKGEIRLDPKRKFIVSGLLGEAMVLKVIWVCKEGYIPYQVASLRGWNADFGPSTTHTPKAIELVRSPLASGESCLDLQP